MPDYTMPHYPNHMSMWLGLMMTQAHASQKVRALGPFWSSDAQALGSSLVEGEVIGFRLGFRV